jgi:hypothetical protein
VGNGVTNWKYDGTPAYFHMAYYHGLIDDVLYNNVNSKCNITYYDIDNSHVTGDCKTWMDKF